MYYVYILRSEIEPARHYVGLTNDTARRLAEHNAGKSIHTNKFKPWNKVVEIGFDDPAKADTFELYLSPAQAEHLPRNIFEFSVSEKTLGDGGLESCYRATTAGVAQW